MQRPLDLHQLTYGGEDGWPLSVWTTARQSTTSETVVLLHGGGPDHHSMVPLACWLGPDVRTVLPDIRGYGHSVCRDASRHTWTQYADDVVALLDKLGIERASLVGAGIGTTIALRTAVEHAARVRSLALISVEDIEDDVKKAAEIAFMDAFGERASNAGLEAAWAPILPDLAPIIAELVREAMPRCDAASMAAAAHIGRDRAFRTVEDLATVDAPTLVFPGMDARHGRARHGACAPAAAR